MLRKVTFLDSPVRDVATAIWILPIWLFFACYGILMAANFVTTKLYGIAAVDMGVRDFYAQLFFGLWASLATFLYMYSDWFRQRLAAVAFVWIGILLFMPLNCIHQGHLIQMFDAAAGAPRDRHFPYH